MRSDLTIGALAKASGVKIPTIRYYEEIGLVPAPSRSEGGQRRYDLSALRRLRFIRHARDLGFDVDAIRTLLELAGQPDAPCANADFIARAHLASIDDKISRLQALRGELVRMTAICENGRIAECRVIEVLADHTLCETDHS